MGPLPPTADDRLIWDQWLAQYRLPAVSVADEVGIFGALGDAALTTGELADKITVDPRSLAILLSALSSSGLLEKRLGKWNATPEARTWLHPQAEGYWGSFFLRFRQTNPIHGQLLHTLRTGHRPDERPKGAAEWEKGAMTEEIAHQIATMMHAHSMGPARGAAAQEEFGKIASLMDIGCGSGVYGIEIAKAHRQLQVTLLDLGEMCAEAQKFVAKAGLADRITTVAVNMFKQDWPTGHEGHFFSNVFHDWSDETNRLLARKSFDALPSGGRIFLNEILMDDDDTGPWPAAAFSLMMLIGTLGKQYSLPEFRDILESAGFVDVQAARTGGGYYSLVSALKP